MLDNCQRNINYLRMSITQRCNLNCIYCTSSCEKVDNEMQETLLPNDFEKIVVAMANLGITRVRITGGEPLIREDVCEIINKISKCKLIKDISLTTNGILLNKYALNLKKAGLKRVNISLDSLKDERIRKITGSSCLNEVLIGVKKVLEVGISPVRINVVLIKGINDDEIDNFINVAKEYPVDVRFIELMPMSKFGQQNSSNIIYNNEIINSHPNLKPVKIKDDVGPATYYTSDELIGNIGFISPFSHKFCHKCNRIRLTADGKIRPCLAKNGEFDIVPYLNQSPLKLQEFIKNIILCKPSEHSFEKGFVSKRNMNEIGG